MKRRMLVLTDEAARHPFLASLPPHVRRVGATAAAPATDAARTSGWRDVLTTYCATFVAALLFVA